MSYENLIYFSSVIDSDNMDFPISDKQDSSFCCTVFLRTVIVQ